MPNLLGCPSLSKPGPHWSGLCRARPRFTPTQPAAHAAYRAKYVKSGAPVVGSLRQRRIADPQTFRSAFAREQAPGASLRWQTRSTHFVVRAIAQQPESYPQSRLGLVIAKRHLKLSVDRNRIKRIVRTVFTVEALPAWDVFVRLNQPLTCAVRSPALTSEIEHLWQKVRARLAAAPAASQGTVQ